MVKHTIWITMALLLQWLGLAGQTHVIEKPVPGDSSVKLLRLNVHFPFGQCFLKASPDSQNGYFKGYLPHTDVKPVSDIQRRDSMVNMTVSFSNPNQQVESHMSESKGRTMYSYKITSSNTLQDADQYMWELCPGKLPETDLNLNMGYGNARLDLSDLSIRRTSVRSGASDIIVTYSRPNRVRMEQMQITGMMSTIVLRNPELARADVVDIRNGMGTTKILLGDYKEVKTNYFVEVGAGACLLIADEFAPVKIILKNGFFSTVDIPETYFNTAPNTFENLAAKDDPEHTSTFIVDLGLGKFSVLTINKIETKE